MGLDVNSAVTAVVVLALAVGGGVLAVHEYKVFKKHRAENALKVTDIVTVKAQEVLINGKKVTSTTVEVDRRNVKSVAEKEAGLIFHKHEVVITAKNNKVITLVFKTKAQAENVASTLQAFRMGTIDLKPGTVLS